MTSPGQVKSGADVESGLVAVAGCVGCRVVNLDARRESWCELSLDLPSSVEPVAVVSAAVEPVSASAIRGPRTESFLKPDRQEYPNVRLAKPPSAITRWQLNERKGTYLWSRLAFANEPDLDDELRVSWTVREGSRPRRAIDKRRDEMDLNLGSRSVVHLEMGRGADPSLQPPFRDGSRVDLPCVERDGLRIVGRVRWTGTSRADRDEEADDEPGHRGGPNADSILSTKAHARILRRPHRPGRARRCAGPGSRV